MLQWCGLCVLGWVHKHAVQKWINWLCAGLGNRSCWPRKPLSNGGRNSPRGTFKGDICQPIEKYRDYEIVKVSLKWWGSLLPNYPGQKAGYSTCPVALDYCNDMLAGHWHRFNESCTLQHVGLLFWILSRASAQLCDPGSPRVALVTSRRQDPVQVVLDGRFMV